MIMMRTQVILAKIMRIVMITQSKTIGECWEALNRRNQGLISIESKSRRPLITRSRWLQIQIYDKSSEESNTHYDATFLEDACCNWKHTLPIGLGRESTEKLPYKIGVGFAKFRDLQIRRVFWFIRPALQKTGADGRQLATICGQCTSSDSMSAFSLHGI